MRADGENAPARARASYRGAALRDVGWVTLAALLILAASPPLEAWPLAFVGLALLQLDVREASAARAAVLGWVCGFFVNALGFAWGADLLERFVHVSNVTGVAAVAALAAYQACVFALWLGGSTYLRRRFGVSAILAAPLAVAIAEAAVPFLFPWYLAICVVPAWPLLQVAELGGAPAVSALLLLLSTLLAELLVWVLARRAAASARRRAASPLGLGVQRAPSSRALVVGGVVAAVVVAGGLARAAHVARARHHAAQERVGVVQPNLPLVAPKERALRATAELTLLRAATAEAESRGADLVVWPESSFPYLVDRGLTHEYPVGHPWALRAGAGKRLLFGALTHDFGTDHVFNSVVLVGADGRLDGAYDKNRLLAFGEYVPFADRYPDWAARMRARMDDFPEIAPGAAPALLIDGPLRIAPLICYEDLLPDHAGALAARGANLLVTSANHAWFGGSVAPRQAELLALLRGVETRRDLVRATSTGVSSVSDALGRELAVSSAPSRLDGVPARPEILVVDVALLEIRALGPTVVLAFPWLCAAVLALAAVAGRRRARR